MTPTTPMLRPVIGITGDHLIVVNPPDPANPQQPPATQAVTHAELNLYVDDQGRVLALTADQVRQRTFVPPPPGPQPPVPQSEPTTALGGYQQTNMGV